jgi:methyl-accepting chemotaxis protein
MASLDPDAALRTDDGGPSGASPASSVSSDLADLHGAREEIGRAKGLLSSAVAKLNESFTFLSSDTDNQRAQVQALIEDMSGDLSANGGEAVNIKAFVDQTGELLTSFADMVTHFSKQSVGIAYKIDDMVAQMSSIFRMIEQVDAIAEDTNILAINAALEAVRAGERGKGFGVVASEVRTLSRKTKGLNDGIVESMKDAEASIKSVREAVGQMASHDMTIAIEAKGDLDVVVKRLNALQDNVEKTLADLEVFTKRVAENASDAVVGLQFEDLVTQVLDNVDCSGRARRVGLPAGRRRGRGLGLFPRGAPRASARSPPRV